MQSHGKQLSCRGCKWAASLQQQHRLRELYSQELYWVAALQTANSCRAAFGSKQPVPVS